MRSDTISFAGGTDEVADADPLAGPLNASPNGFVVAALNAASACDRGSVGRLGLSAATHASNISRARQLFRPESF